ncbi:unnamed protein product [Penicillium roqueforti FM164]|uniref:Genomic scaffold, ProqFM164S01 n=1 Tax=Penicillium roqueforti (strain FM164) TaxID=1365484 RepID=W6PVU1_PENRF|nr:unnamed protein product [Penicillium roqueforti FM164]
MNATRATPNITVEKQSSTSAGHAWQNQQRQTWQQGHYQNQYQAKQQQQQLAPAQQNPQPRTSQNQLRISDRP